MNYRMLGYLLSIVLLIEAALMLLPMGVALIYSESPLPFVFAIALMVAVSLPSVIMKPKNTRIFAKEGFVCVALAWILLSAFGALPFVFSGAITNYFDAFFETVSGFTTTGATILTEVESLPKGILFWRSFTHWVGGMGVLVFMLAIVPSKDGQTMHLMRAEVPGPTKGKLVPKMRQTSLILYGIYFVLTVIMVICLLLCDMPLYDSLVNSFATAGTGGFSVLNTSIGGYNNPAAEWVIAIFMVVFGVNFNIYFLLLMGKVKDVVKNEELRTFLLLCFGATVAVAINTWNLFESAGDCIRAAFFQVTTIMSTSGYSTTDFNLWPSFAKSVLILVMITGSCAGSTAGGLKISRVIILFKGMLKEIKHILKPRSVNVIRLDGEPIEDETVRSALGYLALYFVIIVFTVIAVSVDGFDFETNMTATLTCINNVGPGFSVVGPMGNFSGFSNFSTALLSLVMLLGRLEIMPIIILLAPGTWKKR